MPDSVVWYNVKQKAGGGVIGRIVPVVEKHFRAKGAWYKMYQRRKVMHEKRSKFVSGRNAVDV